ncbi:sensor domain-containing protein [Mycolicibacterium phlei]
MRAATVTVVAVGALLAGCATTTIAEPPAVRIAEVVAPSPDRTLDRALPTLDEMSSLTGSTGFVGQLVEGGPEMLLQAADAAPADCLAAAGPLQQTVYAAGPVRSVVSQSWAGGDANGPSATGFFGVVQFTDSGAAQQFFATSADKWHRCNGQMLVQETTSSLVTDVAVDDRIVSAVVMKDSGTTVQRALGAVGDAVVDVEITDVAGPSPTGAAAAVAVANLMMQKIGVR